MKVADAIRSRDEFPDPTFLYHQHVTELEAILVVARRTWRLLRFRSPQGSEGTSGSSRNVQFGGDG